MQSPAMISRTDVDAVLLPDEAAALLGMSAAAVLVAAEAGEIPGTRFNGPGWVLWRFSRRQLLEHVRSGVNDA